MIRSGITGGQHGAGALALGVHLSREMNRNYNSGVIPSNGGLKDETVSAIGVSDAVNRISRERNRSTFGGETERLDGIEEDMVGGKSRMSSPEG